MKGRSASAYPLLLPETTTLLSSSSADGLQEPLSQNQGPFLSAPAALPLLIGGEDHAADRILLLMGEEGPCVVTSTVSFFLESVQDGCLLGTPAFP